MTSIDIASVNPSSNPTADPIAGTAPEERSLEEVRITAGHPRYRALRSSHVRAGTPAVILQPSSIQQVAQSVRFARRHGGPLSVRSGGHGFSGRSTNAGGVVIELSKLHAITVLDPATRRVRVEAGATWGAVAAALTPLGWAISSGDHGGVGVGGLATAGGIGLLGRAHGLTIDSVAAVDMVLADSSIVRASEREHTDLFWAVRGAGFAMGIVTAFEFTAAPVGEVGYARFTYDASELTQFLTQWADRAEKAPQRVTSFLTIGAPWRGQVVAEAVTVVDSDDTEAIVADLEPFTTAGPLLNQQVYRLPYSGVIAEQRLDAYGGQGEPVSRSVLIDHVSPDFAQAATQLITSGQSYFFQLRTMGGAIAEVSPSATAFAHRQANFQVVAMGFDPHELDVYWDRIRGMSRGLYVSFETDTDPHRLKEAFPPATLERLRAAKQRHDPQNVFRDNFDLTQA